MQFAAAKYEPVVIELPAIVKAIDAGDRRLIEVESSVEAVDLEGDIIEQKALLDAAPEFVARGHIDIDHLSELGARLGIRDPDSYIVGKPTEVKDIGNKRTSVVAELYRAPDGEFNVMKNRFDAVWQAIKSGERWKASIYGFPTQDGLIDCRSDSCPSSATRFHITKIYWKSLALTKTPVNDAIASCAKIITAKSFMLELLKSGASDFMPPNIAMSEPDNMLGRVNAGPVPYIPGRATSDPSSMQAHVQPSLGLGTVPPTAANATTPSIAQAQSGAPGMPASTGEHQPVWPGEWKSGACPAPRNLSDAMGLHFTHNKSCPHTSGTRVTAGLSKHFAECCGMPSDLAEIYGHALAHALLLQGRRV